MRRLHFITGLPRAGSTLLAGILRQNPRFHAGMTSPVGALVNAALRVSGDGEAAIQMTEEKTERLIRGIFQAYYDDVPHAEVIFDTNRQWSAHLPMIARFAPEARVIACVRNPAWVMDSIEQITRRNPLRRSRLFQNDGERATVYTRTDALTRQDRLIGFAWTALKEAYFSDQAGRLLLLEYDILCQRPQEAIDLVYRFLGEPPFTHDFDAVDYDAEAFDAFLNTPGLHRVRRKVAWEPRRSVLPPDLFTKLAGMAFWQENHPTLANRIVTSDPAAPPSPPGHD